VSLNFQRASEGLDILLENHKVKNRSEVGNSIVLDFLLLEVALAAFRAMICALCFAEQAMGETLENVCVCFDSL
jgi:hypothetical protein